MRNPNPSFFSDGLHHSTGIIELGDLALDKEVAVKLSTTVQKNGLISVEVNPFINSIGNFMFLPLVLRQLFVVFPVWEYQQTNARLVELTYRPIGK
jgi:iron complex outermembrane receptor protein